jgi:hypothetical protein
MRYWHTLRVTSALVLFTLAALIPCGCATAWHDVAEVVSLGHQPADQTINAQQTATFSIVASSVLPVTYQWFQNGVLIGGAASASYTTPKMGLSSNGATFTVAVTNSTTTVTSSPAKLTVLPLKPALAFSPIAPVVYGAPAFSIDATSTSSAPISYSLANGPATLNGSLVSVDGVGTVALSASQPAMGDYAAATATATFAVGQNVTVGAVSPANQTMGPGQVMFHADAIGGPTNELRWSAIDGTFSGSSWTSPSTAGTYVVTATSVDDPTKSASTSVVISAPVITQQPQSQSVCPGTVSSLTVAANYAQTYQWSKNSTSLSGSTSATYLIASANGALDAGTYVASVSNPAGTASSGPAVVTVGSSIVSQPASVSVAVTQSAILSVNVSGMPAFRYQWYLASPDALSAVPIAGATASSYTTPAVSAGDNGDQYYVIVTDACGTQLTSSTATITVTGILVPPTIETQPVSQHINPGGTATFSVVASGSPTLMYQWYVIAAGQSAGNAIPGAISASYDVPASATLITNDQDRYFVNVSNLYGAATSQQATLSVGSGINITQQPASLYVAQGATGTFTVAATSSLPLTYQWYLAAVGTSSFTPIAAATNASYTIPAASASDNGSTYYVVVSNGVNSSVQSATAALTVGDPKGVADCDMSWTTNGNAFVSDTCSYQLTEADVWQAGSIVWPKLISTGKIRLSFTATLSNPSAIPADGFALMFGDPSLGATPTSLGEDGEGLGAKGIPGVVIAFDVYYNSGIDWPTDPRVPYIGIGRGEENLWEDPYFSENSSIPALATFGQSISHDYVVTVDQGTMDVTMDGALVLSSKVDLPPVAYLYVTASTGIYWEQTVISNITAVVSAP